MKRKIFSMRNLTVLLTFIFLFTVIMTQGECQEIFVRIKQVKRLKSSSGKVAENKTQQKENNESKSDNKNVRIVIKNADYSSIYHSQIDFLNSGLTVYYGKNYKNKKVYHKLKLSADSKIFQKNNVIKVEAQKPLHWNNHSVNGSYASYPGMFYIYKTKNGMVAVNEVNMEDYVAAVISSEMGESSPLEALKAQAVCARTYILKTKKQKYKKYNAIADDSTDFQVYNRIEPDEKCRKAAKATKNMIMTYEGKPITAYYFSTSCGMTTDYKIWGKKKIPYLKGANLVNTKLNLKNNDDFKKFILSNPKGEESQYPYYRWRIYLTKEQIENGIFRSMGVSPGKINKIEVNTRGVGGIISNLTVYGKQRQIVIKNQNEIRKAISSPYGQLKLNNGEVVTGITMLPSAFFAIEDVYKNGNITGFYIYGGGFGHGSGMSQNGAEKMAENGKDYVEILTTFYDGIKIETY